jgi:acetyl-CoA acetyltransferase
MGTKTELGGAERGTRGVSGPRPLGASGTRLMGTLVNAVADRGARYGLQTMCEAGGQANATVLELL